jgi:hypothetical protein
MCRAGDQNDHTIRDRNGARQLRLLDRDRRQRVAQRKGGRFRTRVHTKKYPTPTSAVSRPRHVSSVPPTAWRQRRRIGTKDDSIIATIITTHMRRNDAAAPGQVCPGVRHALDIVQPPGIGIRSIADMAAHQTIVTAALAPGAAPRRRRRLAGKLARKPCDVRSPGEIAQPLSYSLWRRHQTPVSLRPLGARSSHWYMPQRPSSPRA